MSDPYRLPGERPHEYESEEIRRLVEIDSRRIAAIERQYERGMDLQTCVMWALFAIELLWFAVAGR